MNDIWWQTIGEGDCHLVLLHGWGLNAQVWDCITPQLASHFTLHLVDLPGYGRSGGFGAMSLEAMAQRVLEQALQQAAPMASLEQVFADKEQVYYLLVVHKEAESSAVEALRRHGFLPIRFKDMMGTAQENIDALQIELQELEAQRQAQVDRIVACKAEREALRLCADRTQQELQKQRAQECLLTDGTIVFLEGWVAVTGLESLKQELDAFDCTMPLQIPTILRKFPFFSKTTGW